MGAGCSKVPEVQSIQGVVSINGNPMVKGLIRFWPKSDSKLGCVEGLITDGNYLLCPRLDRGEGGAGRFIVLILPPPGVTIPEKYKKAATTPLEFDLKPGVNHLDPINIEAAPGAGSAGPPLPSVPPIPAGR